MDFTELMKAITGTAGAVDAISKAVRGTQELIKKRDPDGKVDASPVDQLLGDLLDKMFSLQAAQNSLFQAAATLQNERTALEKDRAALVEERSRLKQQQDELTDFRSKANGLRLVTLSDHSYAYAIKEAVGSAEDSCYYCQPCFDTGKISTLHFEKRDFHFDLLRCPRCDHTVRKPNDNRPTITTVPGSRRRGWEFFDDF